MSFTILCICGGGTRLVALAQTTSVQNIQRRQIVWEAKNLVHFGNNQINQINQETWLQVIKTRYEYVAN